MTFHQLRCAICDNPVAFGADQKKRFVVYCKTCEVCTPLEQLVSQKKDLTYGNHLKGKGKPKPE